MKRLVGLFLLLAHLYAYSHESTKPKYHLSICAIFQNEEFFLKEWIEYHKLVGVQHFYLYNNLSTDSSLEILQSYIEEGTVDLFQWPVYTKCQEDYLKLLQVPAYLHALEIAKEETSWAAFIDIDEFMLPLKHDNLNDLLQEYAAYPGIAVNWQIFGTSGLDELPYKGLIIENLVWKANPDSSQNEYVKYIVQPKYVADISNPHAFYFSDKRPGVDTNFTPIKPGLKGHPVVLNTLQINHYWFGTKNWLIANKLPRREKWGLHLTEDQVELLIAPYNVVKDESILKYVEKLKPKLSEENL